MGGINGYKVLVPMPLLVSRWFDVSNIFLRFLNLNLVHYPSFTRRKYKVYLALDFILSVRYGSGKESLSVAMAVEPRSFLTGILKFVPSWSGALQLTLNTRPM